MKNTDSKRISDSVMRQIKQGNVAMRPRLYFAALGIVSIFGIVLLGLITSYLASILFFWIRIQTADTMAWGARANLQEIMNSFPWWAVLLMVIIFGLMVWLIRHQGAMYKYKLSTIVVFVVLVSVISGIILSNLGIGSGPMNRLRDSGSQIQRGPGGRMPSL